MTMMTSESISKLSAALVKAKESFGFVGKSGENKFDKYSYAKLEDYIAATSRTLCENGLCIITSVDDVVELAPRTTQRGGSEHVVRVKVTTRLMHDSGEWIEATGWGEGQDRADKSVYKAITGARKYAIASVLGISTSDDPEADEKVGLAERPKDRPSKKPAPNKKLQHIAARFKSLYPRASKDGYVAWVKKSAERESIDGIENDEEAMFRLEVCLEEIENAKKDED